MASSLESIAAAVRDEYSAAVASLLAPCCEEVDAELVFDEIVAEPLKPVVH